MKKEELLQYLQNEGFSSKIIEVFRKIKREDFVRKDMLHLTYENIALPLTKGATISQPSTIAYMLELLNVKEGQNILEIGSGSGYVLALISSMIKKGKIYGIEIIKELAEKSKEILKKDKKIVVFQKDV